MSGLTFRVHAEPQCGFTIAYPEAVFVQLFWLVSNFDRFDRSRVVFITSLTISGLFVVSYLSHFVGAFRGSLDYSGIAIPQLEWLEKTLLDCSHQHKLS